MVNILWNKDAIAVDFVVTYRISFFTASISGDAFYGVDSAFLDLFDDADMVGYAVLAAFFG